MYLEFVCHCSDRNVSALGMVKLALVPIRALFSVRTRLLDAGARPGSERSGHFQKAVQGWSVAPIGIIRGHELIINEGVH